MKTKKLLSLVLAVIMTISTLTFISCGSGGYNIPIVCGETGMNDIAGYKYRYDKNNRIGAF